MMEIVVCLLVMSILVIGASGLLLQSKRLARHSALRAQAALLGAELTQLVRLGTRIPGSAWPKLAAGGMLELRPAEMATAGGGDCGEQGCSPAQAQALEVEDWARRAAALLPGARVLICRDRNPWDPARGSMRWACSGEDEAILLVKLGWLSPLDRDELVPAPQLALPAQ